MSAGKKIPLEEALAIAESVSAELKPLVQRMKCVGSVRRRRQRVTDIEFLVEPYFEQGLFDHGSPITDPVKRKLLDLGTWVQGGPRQMRITDLYGRAGLQLELFLVHPPASWGSLLAIRTGPGDLGKYVMTMCRQKRIRHEKGFAQHMDTGARIPTDSEEQFFALADVPIRPPHQRDVLASSLWKNLQNHGGDRAAALRSHQPGGAT